MRFALLVVSVLVGCGPTTTLGGDGGSGGDSGTDGQATGASATGGGDLDTGGDAGVDDGGSGGDSGTETGGDDPPQAELCGALPDALVGLVAESGQSEAGLLRGDGSIQEIDVAPLNAPSDTLVSPRVAASGDSVAVVSSWGPIDNGPASGFTIRMFDAAGELQWEREEINASLDVQYAGPDGTLVGWRRPVNGDGHGVRYLGPGASQDLGSFYPWGSESGKLIPGRMFTDGPVDMPGWYDVDAGAFVPVTIEPWSGWMVLHQDAIVYATADALIVERPTELAVVEFTGAPVMYPLTHSAEWVLLRDPEATQFARVSLTSLTFENVELEPPTDLEFFVCFQLVPGIDDLGRVLVPVRDIAAGQIQRLDPSRGTWDSVGLPVTLIDDIEATVAGSTVLVRSSAQNSTFCPAQSFEPRPGLLEGHKWQAVRPDEGVEYVLPVSTTYAYTSVNGECVAYTAEDGSVLLDTVTGNEISLDERTVNFVG